MIPYLLAIAGGYLIGSSRKDEKFADGGNIGMKELWYVTDYSGSVKNISTSKEKAQDFLAKQLKYNGSINYLKVPSKDWESEKVSVSNIKRYASSLWKYKDGGVIEGFDNKQTKKIKDILSRIEDMLSSKSGVSYTGGGNYHYFVQLKDNTWIGFHNSSGDITLSEKFKTFRNLENNESWEKVTYKVFNHSNLSDNVSDIVKDIKEKNTQKI